MNPSDFIPVNVPLLEGNEEKYVSDCLRTGWISSEGPAVREFEEKFAARMGRKFGIAVCNGSAALDAAVAALRLNPGDEVLLPSFTIISCAAAIVRAGAMPVVVDCDPATWNSTAAHFAEKITSRTRAIMVVHLYGLPTDMDPVLALAKEHGLAVIEDAAEMHGQTYRGKPCGSFGDLSTFSFYPNKHITTGEGGMIVTDDAQLAERCRSLRNLCFKPGRRFVHDELGWNLRMTNLQAALGLAQLEQLDTFVERKRHLGATYQKLLAPLRDRVELPLAETGYAKNIYWVFGIVLKATVPFDAEEAMRRLEKKGIGTRPFFWPMHEQPVFRNRGWFVDTRLPVAENLARRGFYVPSGLALSDAQMQRVAQAVSEILA